MQETVNKANQNRNKTYSYPLLLAMKNILKLIKKINISNTVN